MNTLKDSSFSTIDKRILSDHYNSIIFKTGEEVNIYIVGGYLRDILLGRKTYDRDYVIKGDFKNFLKTICTKINGKLIRIGKKNLYRIILKNGQMLDFMPLYGNIENDISKRDFTINSLAWSPKTGIIDIYNGISDLKKRDIRMITIENLKDDPMRILRAYRMAEELSLNIEHDTRKAIITISNMIKNISTERITLEVFRILNLKDPVIILKLLLKDGILSKIISFHYKELHKRLNVINRINKKLDKLHLKSRFKSSSVFSQNLTNTGLIRLEILLHGMPENRLNLSSAIIRRLVNITRAFDILKNNNNRLTKNILFELFSNAADASDDLIIIYNSSICKKGLKRYNAIMKKGILSSEDIIKITKIPKGRILGKTINAIKKAEFENKIRSKRDAKRFLLELCRSYHLT